MDDAARVLESEAVERIADAYLGNASGDPYRALTSVILDALDDLHEAERARIKAERCVSAGFVRAALPARA